jgi:SAM-dependent methyltransferase
MTICWLRRPEAESSHVRTACAYVDGSMKRLLKKAVLAVIPIWAVRSLNRLLRAASAFGHHVQFQYEWGAMERAPEWFDHYIDLHWKWKATRNPTSWERGTFGLLAMRPGCRVLDLCCGTGFFDYYFYSGRAGHVVAVDHDSTAITHAKRNFHAPNIEFLKADIRTQMPAGSYDNIVLNAALEYFTAEESDALLQAIKARLTTSGILNGNSIVAEGLVRAHLDQKQAFFSRSELGAILRRYFTNVTILETRYRDIYETRTNLHFFASDGPTPLGPEWPDIIRLSKV